MPTIKRLNNLPVLNRALTHWTELEIMTADSVTLPDGTTRDRAQDLATSIQDAEAALMTARNTLSVAQGARNQARIALYPAAKQARKSLRGLAKNVPEVLGLPTVPPVTSAPAVFVAALEDIADVWGRVNALPQASVPAAHLPLRIPLTENNTLVSLTLEQLNARLVALRSAAQALTQAADSVTVSIGIRDGLHEQAAAVVKDYGVVARSVLPESHPLLKTIPKRTGG
jgi:hypothetical protein